MEKLSWSKELSVGVKEIDNQHKNLIKLMNEVSKLLESKKDTSKREKEVLNDFLEYVRIHFTTEEEYFDKTNFPEKEEHMDQHANVTEAVLELSMLSKETELKKGLKNIMGEFVNHITKYDMKYRDYFKKIGFKG